MFPVIFLLCFLLMPAVANSSSSSLAFQNRNLNPTVKDQQIRAAFPDLRQTTDNNISLSTRAYWMRQANNALKELESPCPFSAFGSVIVNHTDPGKLGELVCIGVNENGKIGNPTLHGEISAISNCTDILRDPYGKYKLSPSEVQDAFKSLSLYTNAESCPMCASAIRWAGFKEYIFGTSIEKLISKGWGQIHVSSTDVFRASGDLPSKTKIIGNTLTNETDPYFLWQYDAKYPCPRGCGRSKDGSKCEVLS